MVLADHTFAFANEDVAVVDANENVGLACAVESCPRHRLQIRALRPMSSMSRFLPVELATAGVPNAFRWLRKHPKCGLVVLILHCRLRLQCCPRARRAVYCGRTLFRLIGAAYVGVLRRTGKPIRPGCFGSLRARRLATMPVARCAVLAAESIRRRDQTEVLQYSRSAYETPH